ncbi:hypothetical protein C5613_36435 [Rhodococcus opacus]|uniref:Uncharacterized protein n=1 Tax=Rhodococcus opacus TaxID=37919 RepID=A0A2S8INM8_RHOOP|nr:hypothetical protein C5613_36435 [Rhodococcus opacus]
MEGCVVGQHDLQSGSVKVLCAFGFGVALPAVDAPAPRSGVIVVAASAARRSPHSRASASSVLWGSAKAPVGSGCTIAAVCALAREPPRSYLLSQNEDGFIADYSRVGSRSSERRTE